MSQPPLIIAHRGDSRHAPENTLAAFRAAERAGADWIELDLHMTRDGELICMHDFTLERTTDAAYRFPDASSFDIPEFDLSEIRRLDAGFWFASEFEREGVPTLREALEVVDSLKRRMGVLLELKDAVRYGDRMKSLIESVVSIVSEFGFADPDGVALQSFHPEVVQAVGEIAPEKTRIQLAPPFDQFIPTVFSTFEMSIREVGQYAHGMALPEADATREVVEKSLDAGLFVFSWTVNSVIRAQQLAAHGVRGIITDDPSAMRAAF